MLQQLFGQQVTVAGATRLAGRLVSGYGTAVPGIEPLGLTHLFPTAEALAAAALDDVGLTKARARAVAAFADAVATGKVELTTGRALDETVASLCALPGIGEWTAQYIAMRALAWPDAFPHTDLGVMKALGTKDAKRVLAAAEAWRPWRAYAVMHLWNSLAKD